MRSQCSPTSSTRSDIGRRRQVRSIPTRSKMRFRHALRVLADSGRALEVNTKAPVHPGIVAWWREEGGEAITFGSDAHDPTVLALGFGDAAAMVEAHGFRPGRHPYDFWRR